MSRHRPLRMLAAACSLMLLVTAVGDRTSASGGADTKPPLLWIVKTGEFIDDTTVETLSFGDDHYSSMPLRLHWGAKDPSGICGYSLRRIWTGGPPDDLFRNQLRTDFVVAGDEYNGDYGGGSTLIAGWEVTATDCAGNESAPRYIPNQPSAIQDDGASSTGPPGTVTFQGRWKVSHCDCWSAGTTRKTWQGGATATYTASFQKGEHVAVVMAVGPDRGKARILVDGVRRAKIDTGAAERAARQVAWEGWMSAGEHTITVVNLSTPGRRRIDVDAFLHSRR